MELLPCPFCGGEALPTAHLTYNWFAPVCRRCNARGPSVKIERDSDPQEMRNLMNQADENWNRRASPASAPEGFALVPVEPTPEMLTAGEQESENKSATYETVFAAMLAAVPTLAAWPDGTPRAFDNYEHDKRFAADSPTPPVSEDRKDAELLDYIQNHGATIQIVPMANRTFGFEVGGLHKSRKLSVREAIDAAMQEDKP